MPSHQLREFTSEQLGATRQQWAVLAGEDVFDVELAQLFDWCEAHLSPSKGDSRALELYNTERDQTDAILDVVDHTGRVKLLKLWPSPEFWGIETQQERQRVVDLHVQAFVQVIATGIVNGAPVVKIYGRSNLMLKILQELQAIWPGDETGWNAAMQGRWLAISPRS